MNRRRFLLALGATPIAVGLAPLVGRRLDAATAVQVRPSRIVSGSLIRGSDWNAPYTPKYLYGVVRVSKSSLIENIEYVETV